MAAALLALAGCDNMRHQSKTGETVAPRNTIAFHAATDTPPTLSLGLVERGQQRFRIYCTPCHSELGDGRGMIVQRGFPEPPSYHTDRLRAAPMAHFYDVITHGYGVMYGFADRIEPQDRWAIAAYIRALQHSAAASDPQPQVPPQ